MLSKLLSLLVAGKGGAVAAAIVVAGATTVGVVTTSPEVQDTVSNVVNAVTTVVAPDLAQADKKKDEDKDRGECDRGKPVVVAQRNAADKALRDAFEDQHKRLEHARDGKDLDHQKANELLQKADREMRAVLTKALNDVGALTQGREGQERDEQRNEQKAGATPAATPTGTPTATPTPTPTSTPTATPTPAANTAATPTPTPGAKAECAASSDAKKAAVTLNAKIKAIVDKAKADMKAIADKALAAVAVLPAVEHGKSDEHGKPEAGKSDEHGKSDDHDKVDEHKPSQSPRPTPTAGRP